MARIPYNIEFCRFKECVNLKQGDKCKKKKCIYNQKWIIFWEKTGVWKGE